MLGHLLFAPVTFLYGTWSLWIRSTRGSYLNIICLKHRYIDPTGLVWGMTKQGENHYWGRKLSTVSMKRVRAGHTEPLQRLEALTTVQQLLHDGGRDWHQHIER
jgi:hypothetical protein